MLTAGRPPKKSLPEKIAGFFKGKKGKILLLFLVLLICFTGFKTVYSKGAQARKGVKLCQEGKYSEAQICFRNAIEKNNLNADYYYYLGMALLGTNDVDSAMKQFQLSLNINSEQQGAFRGLGIASIRKGEYEQAIEYLNLAIEYSGSWINEVDYDILWYRAYAETAIEDYDAAAYTYGALIELEGDRTITRYYRGNIYCLMKDKEKAMADFDAAIGEGKQSYELYWNIYDSMTEAGWKEEALTYLKMTQIDGYVETGKNASTLDNEKYKGMISFLCGDYRQAISVLGSESFAADTQAQIYLALAYEANGEKTKAQELFLKQANAASADAATYNRIARFYIRCGDGDSAAEWLEKGIEKFDASGTKDLSYNLITAYETAGKYEQALEALKKYVRAYGESSATNHEMTYLKARK